ncbi:unnamed protein product [Chrysoparadoxa australica]
MTSYGEPSGADGISAAPKQKQKKGDKAPASADKANNKNLMYSYDEEKLEAVRKSKPWMQDPKYFKKVKISPSAAMKMLMHANSGVDKGIKKGGKPVEVMGMMIGRPDTEALNCLVVTDVFPLPIEGAETRVLADDEEVTNYMIELGESLELTRKERFMGWYHSHPFDVEVHSHCFLSSTDLSTQLSWQRAEDPHGNAWLAIVIDPLRSLAKGRPEFGAFRAYPPEHTATPNETPNGKIVTDDTLRVEMWGSCWNRYYSLDIEYFTSSMASDVMGILTENFLWTRTLSSTPMLEKEHRDRVSERCDQASDKLEQCSSMLTSGSGGGRAGYLSHDRENKEESLLAKATQGFCELAVEHCNGQLTQLTKAAVFDIASEQQEQQKS